MSHIGGNDQYRYGQTTGNEFRSSAPKVQIMPRLPIVYSQSNLRNQLMESEPLSEFSEPQTYSRLQSPHQQIPKTHGHVGRLENQPLTPRRVQFFQDVRDVPYERNMAPQPVLPPTPQLMYSLQKNPVMMQKMTIPAYPPSPQCFITNYNPDPTFNMQSTSPSTSTTSPAKASSTNNSSITNKSTVTSKHSQQNLKLNSVSRRRFFVSSVEQLARWHKVAKKTQMKAIYEVPAILDSLSYKPPNIYQLILRSEKNNTPPLQAVYFLIDRELPKVNVGDLITCIGRMIGTNKLQVYDMWTTNPDSLAGLKRIAFLCQRTLQETDLALPEP